MIVRISIAHYTDPVVKLYRRSDLVQVGTVGGYACTPSIAGTQLRSMNVGSLIDGDYEVVCTNPDGVWKLRIASGNYQLSDSWAEIEAGQGIPGQFAVPVTVRNSSGFAPIAGAVVTVLQSGVVIQWKYSLAGGIATFALNPGSYTINCSTTGFTAITGQAITVSSLGVVTPSSNVDMVAQVITPPPVSGLCNVQFNVTDAGVPVVGARVKAELLAADAVIPSYLVAQTSESGLTDSNGTVTLTLVQYDTFVHGDGRYRITVVDPATGSKLNDRKVRVPTQSTCTASDLIDAN